ncbi:MAG TPA: hypothetical protein VIH28_06880 [Ignavibacteriaceae bacterium]
MTKQFNLLQLFSIVDGRLSTKIDDVYLMLNHICDDNLMTHHLPVAMNYLKEKKPKWFLEVEQRLTAIKATCQSNTFEVLIDYIKNNVNDTYDIPQLKDDFDTSDFQSFMVDNSLLLKRMSSGS